MDATGAAKSLHRSPHAVVTQETLLNAIKMVCCVYVEDFRNIHKTHELQGGEDQAESVELLLRDPSYRARRQQVIENNDYDIINGRDMEAFCEFTENVFKCGQH